MSGQAVLLVAIGAAIGAPLRYVVERAMAASWPWGTWSVNVAGSALLGGLLAWAGQPGADRVAAVWLVGTGFCGALTTFSGFAAQVLDLAVGPAEGRGRQAAASLGYAAVSVLACVAVAAAAYQTSLAMLPG